MNLTNKRSWAARKTTPVLPFLLLGVVTYPSTTVAQPAGTFTATGNMATSHSLHTATLLNDGKVLIAGGRSGNFSALGVATAELYDPSMGTFTPTGNMSTPRYSHTATLLTNGKVLIAGGFSSSSDFPGLTSSELYDPATGTFTSTGNMTSAHPARIATLLGDGRVLIGGTDNAEFYDPVTGTFTPVESTSRPSCCLFPDTATLLTDGTVLFAAPGFGFPAAGYRYDPFRSTFSHTGALNATFYGHAASLLMNGKVLLSGGGDADVDVGDVLYQTELYDPASSTFDWATNMSECRWWHASTLLPDGSVLITGGDVLHRYLVSNYCINLSDASPGRAELYDPGNGMFSTTGNMVEQREHHTATLLNDGAVLIAGGTNLAGNLASAELYHPAVLKAPPTLLSLSGDGKGQGAILHANTPQVASSDSPATAGEALEIYCTGLADGSVIPPQVSIGGRATEVLWFGKAPGFVSLNQINVRVPNGIVPGSAVSVRLNYIGRLSNEVTIAVR